MTHKHQSPLKDQTAQEEFIENLELNMAFIEKHLGEIDNTSDYKFAESLIDYFKKFETITAAQLPYATKFWQELNSKGLK